jgi:2-methylcitrate dehydratase PrpD
MTPTIREKLSEYIVNTDYQHLDREVIHQAKRCLLDFLGVAMASGKTGLLSCMFNFVCNNRGTFEATVIGEKFKAPLADAILINAIKGHTLDMDDGNRFGNVHPGVVVIPAVLAMAEQLDIKGKDLLSAIIVGYETLIYIAKSINPSHLKKGFHTTANVGAFGAAAGCCNIMRLNKEQVQNAISIAGLNAGGLLEVLNSGQMVKPYQTARASQAGFMSAYLAQNGVEGPELIFEGKNGFFKAYTENEIDQKNFRDLGKKYEILNTYFKVYSACRHIHPALDAVAEILKRHTLIPETIKAVDIRTYSIAYDLTGHRTFDDSEIAAKFSMPLSISLMITFGELNKSTYSKEKIFNPIVQSIAGKVTIQVDSKRDALYPRERGADVCIKTAEKRYRQIISIPKGEPENPFSDDDLINKFIQNVNGCIPLGKEQEIIETIFEIENKNTSSLFGLLLT